MTVVLKIGGSILGQSGLVEKLRFILNQRADSTRLLIAGGGKTADLVRDWDQTHELGDELAHRLAIAAMDFNAQLLAGLLPEARLSEGGAVEAAESEIVLLRTGPFLVRHEARAEADGEIPIALLPASWNVTSDSIAAWIAIVLNADELVLVKSCPLPVSNGVGDAVDTHFETLAKRLPRISWVDSSEPTPLVREWRTTAPENQIPAVE